MSDDRKNKKIASPFSIFVSVALDQSAALSFDYGATLEEAKDLQIGSRVLVPLHNRFAEGTVIDLKSSSFVEKVKKIEKVLSKEGLLPKELFHLASFLSQYYVTPLAKVLKVMLPSSLRKNIKAKKQLFIKPLLSSSQMQTLCETLRLTSPSQAKILEVILKYPKGTLLSILLEETKSSESPIKTLTKKGVLQMQKMIIERSPIEDFEFFQTSPKKLSQEQKEALDKIRQTIDHKHFEVHLLHGITGSGKTEIYLQAITYAREKNLGVLLLVPEIALTSQTIERLKSRFTEKLGILHHRLSDGERFDMWHAIREGRISIVVGARSAVFSPIQNLGLIIVDEEHEPSYKQTEEQPCYHARDVAILRAKMLKVPALLGSATPSIESYHNAVEGKYSLSNLSKRAKEALLPKVTIVNMKLEQEKEKRSCLFSNPLLSKIKEKVALGEQVLLFLNRRGYHTFKICNSCGKSIKCPHCDLALTYHKKEEKLICHLCLFSLSPPPKQCPECKQGETLQYKGVGTQQVEKTLHAIFPEIRTLRMDADTTRHKGSHEILLKQFRSGKADILIGTQMIAKGLHFPSVTLVGILSPDGALHIPDFRSSENLFQLITQVAGRSGRGELPGEVVIQTYLENHPLFSYASQEDYLGFFKQEIEIRKLFDYPPFSRMAKLTFKGKNEQKTLEVAKRFEEEITRLLPSTFTIYPVIPSGYPKIKDYYRFKLLIKGKSISLLSKTLGKLKEGFPLPRNIFLLIDIDPLSTFF